LAVIVYVVAGLATAGMPDTRPDVGSSINPTGKLGFTWKDGVPLKLLGVNVIGLIALPTKTFAETVAGVKAAHGKLENGVYDGDGVMV
jgi:hypothetical protein